MQGSLEVQLEQLNISISAPKGEEEIQKRLQVVDIINRVEQEKDPEKINNFLKQFIFKIHYKRLIPKEIAALGTKSPKRNEIKPQMKIEYI